MTGEVGGACSVHGSEGKCIWCFGRENWKEFPWNK